MSLFVKIKCKISLSFVVIVLPLKALSQNSLDLDKENLIELNSLNELKKVIEPFLMKSKLNNKTSDYFYEELEKSNANIFAPFDSLKLRRLVNEDFHYPKTQNELFNNDTLLLGNIFKVDSLKQNELITENFYASEIQNGETKPLKNQININYLHIDHDKYLYASSIYTVEYTRKENKNTIVSRINLTSRHEDTGFQGEVDWYHILRNSSYFMINAGIADRFFPKFKAGLSYYQSFKKTWIGEIGSKYFYDNIEKRNQFFGIIGIEKEISNFWINAKYTFEMGRDFRNHFFLQSRMFMRDEKSFITAMAGIGNMPEVNDLNYLAQNKFKIRNTMLGAGYNHFFSRHIQAKALMNWYNYKVNENNRSNQFHLLFSVGYVF